ncbi:MAG: hypothetical protein HY677_07140 [Chloroflexi bacterium]|nr:hypothetical protein [Chloroflexota bacterium]
MGEENEKALLEGKPLRWQQMRPGGAGASTSFAEPPPGERCRAYSREGTMLALLRYDADSGLWRPEKVFRRR